MNKTRGLDIWVGISHLLLLRHLTVSSVLPKGILPQMSISRTGFLLSNNTIYLPEQFPKTYFPKTLRHILLSNYSFIVMILILLIDICLNALGKTYPETSLLAT